MNKFFLFVFTVIFIFVLLLPVNAFADAISGNDFSFKNEDKIINLERTRFIINSPEGYIIIKDEPDSQRDMIKYMKEIWSGWDEEHIKSILTFNNGQEFTVYGVYNHNGEYWGIMPSSHYISYPGWVRMDDLRVIYTREDFEDEYKNEIFNYTGNKDASLKTKKLVIWEWPGSDRAKRIQDDEEFKIEDVSVKSAYKDSDGREWGYVEIRYDYEPHHSNLAWNGWVCIDDPENSNIPAFNPAPEPVKWSPGDFQGFKIADKAKPSSSDIFLYIPLIIGSAAILSFVGIFVFIKLRKYKS